MSGFDNVTTGVKLISIILLIFIVILGIVIKLEEDRVAEAYHLRRYSIREVALVKDAEERLDNGNGRPRGETHKNFFAAVMSLGDRKCVSLTPKWSIGDASYSFCYLSNGTVLEYRSLD